MCHKTIADVDDGFGDRTQHAERKHILVLSLIPENMAQSQDEHSLDQILKFIFFNFLALMEFEIQVPSKSHLLGRHIAEGRIATWMSYISEIQDTIPRVKNYFWKDPMQKKVNLVLQSWSNPASRKIIRWIQCDIRKKLFLLEKGSGMTFLPANLSKETLFQPNSQKWSDWYVVMIKDERESDGCSLEFYGSGGRTFSDTDWLQHIYEGSNKMRFQYCMSSQNSSLNIRAIQGHTGGNCMAPELMGHVAIPHKWKEFLYH